AYILRDARAFFEQWRSTAGISPAELDHAQDKEGHRGIPPVAQFAAQGQALFELRHGQTEVAPAEHSYPHDYAQIGAGVAVQFFRQERLGLLHESVHALVVAAVQHGVSEVREREGGAGPVPEFLVQGDGLFEGRYRPSKVVLESEDKA